MLEEQAVEIARQVVVTGHMASRAKRCVELAQTPEEIEAQIARDYAAAGQRAKDANKKSFGANAVPGFGEVEDLAVKNPPPPPKPESVSPSEQSDSQESAPATPQKNEVEDDTSGDNKS